MGFEATFSRRIEKELAGFPGEKPRENGSNRSSALGIRSANLNSKKSSSRINKRRKERKKVEVTPIQRLFSTCCNVFADGAPGIIPSPQKIERLRRVLDEIKPEDLGLTPQMPYFRRMPTTCQAPPVTYLHLFECDKFSMGIFCFPPSGVIPLHNHPGMTVFSKLLFGNMHIKSYDWVDGVPGQHPEVRLAKVKVDSDFTGPCNTSILYPADGGNMHRFMAHTACAVLDVLGPPYSDPEGRHCTYYIDYPFSRFSAEGSTIPEEERGGYGWLKAREGEPEDLHIVGELYGARGVVLD